MSGLIAGLFEQRATAGGSFHVSQEPPGWVDNLSGWETHTGVHVSPGNAMQMIAVFAAVRILAETLASMPLIVYRRLENGGRSRDPDHYLYPVLHDIANPEMTAYTLRETMMGHLGTWGNAYAEIQFNRRGGIDALWPLRPDRMRVEREEGQTRYIYRLPQKFAFREVTLEPARVLHIRGLGDGLVGYSPIRMARQAVSLAMAAEEFGGRFFANDARPGAVLEHPGQLGDKAHKRLVDSWEGRHGGLKNKHRLAILEEGMKLHEVGLPPQDAQFLQTRKFQNEEIARLYRIPPHMLADLDRATFSNIEHLSLEFVTYTMLPWATRWEQEIGLKLLTGAERRTHFVEHLFEALLRGDIESRYNSYAAARQWGIMNADEIRARENMNPQPDGQGKTYLVPMNMVPADQAASFGFDGSGGGEGRSLMWDAREAWGIGQQWMETRQDARSARSAVLRHRMALAQRAVFADVAARILRRERNDVGAQVRKQLGKRSLDDFDLWLEEFYREHSEFAARQMFPVLKAYAEMVDGAVRDEIGGEAAQEDLETFIKAYAAAYGRRHVTRSLTWIRQRIEQARQQGQDQAEAVEEQLDDWVESRSGHIAHEESTRANNAFAKHLYTLAGVIKIRSVAVGDSCPYCRALDGAVVGINDFFLTSGQEFQPDEAERPLTASHNIGHAPYHDGCDCMNVAALQG